MGENSEMKAVLAALFRYFFIANLHPRPNRFQNDELSLDTISGRPMRKKRGGMIKKGQEGKTCCISLEEMKLNDAGTW